MKYYEMVEPFEDTSIPVFNIFSEKEIIEMSTHTFLLHLLKFGEIATREQVVDEWIAVHWAGELNE